MAHHEVISRSGNAFLLNIRESVLLPGSMSEMHMKDYLVGGHSRKEVCEKYQMNNGYFSTTLGRLIRLNALAARLAPYYTDESSAFD
ncbi:adhesin biosynthesis transcription regulatory family protein [Escherichia coli]|uniref:adhesin biosynthesis transcription regulatory family protein n=1 Tax=Escherichia coli TaxID=562 RepID=UPI001F14CA89|nr:adhesin biosynthesis transcription regulatory family protein [Escherichia coli]